MTDIDRLTRDELLVLTSYMSLESMASEGKQFIQNRIKQELFGIVGDDMVCEEGDLDTQAVGSVVLPSVSTSLPITTHLSDQIPLTDINSEGNFTVEQRFELYKMREQARLDQTRLDHEYRMAKLHQPAGDPASSSSMSLNFSNLIPTFSEDEVEDFFTMFEEVAGGMKWPVVQWPFLLQSTLTGKARNTYISVTDDTRQDYYRLKKAILDTYQLRPEAYRQKFRKTSKKSDQSRVDILYQTIKAFQLWMKSQAVESVEDLTEVIVLENFLNNIEPWVANYLRNKKVDKCNEAATRADDFVLNKKLIKYNSFQGKPRNSGVKPDVNIDQFAQNTHTSSRAKSAAQLSDRCGENDVVACVLERSEEASVAEFSRDNWSSPPSFNPFIYSGKVCLLGHEYDVKVLRDTGSDRTLYLNPNHGSHVSDTCVVLTDLGGPFSAQLVEAQLECDLFQGKAFVGVTDELPVKGVDVILENDLCGMRVRPDDPIVSVAPIVETSTDVLESEFPYVFPLCAMTRSMDGVISGVKSKDVKEPSNGNGVNASQELGDNVDMNDFSDTFYANLDELSELSDKGASGLTELQLHDEEC
ncbi:hypothetical protein Pcinc_009385 [Petrolisthes cinctipes]|uniref:SCAN box domain-containing protein n=1 Tax=Petrolisthes cinctipes TaxID=88211 RepID=A0AAE1G5M2_PETCI|nr:hypothetical protein Pcinc_009385 [Petrolisthes cinctipes]